MVINFTLYGSCAVTKKVSKPNTWFLSIPIVSLGILIAKIKLERERHTHTNIIIFPLLSRKSQLSTLNLIQYSDLDSSSSRHIPDHVIHLFSYLL